MSAQLRTPEDLSGLLKQHRAATDGQGAVDVETRKRRLQAVIDLLVDHHQELCAAMAADFGGRPIGFSLMNDILGSLGSLKYARDHLEEWMGPEPRQVFTPYDQMGAQAWVQYQPKGTVGIIGTWNAPIFTLFSPLASALSAGNRAVLKPSEVVPETARVLGRIIGECLDPLDVAVITGGVEIGQAFAGMPFDHLVFTGSTQVGKKIMRAAADNLVPVTLELGGKSPAIIGSSADIREAARRLAIAKGTNGGQLCISPDLLYVPEAAREEFLEAFCDTYSTLYPTIEGNPNVVSVVNDQHMARIDGYVAQAQEAGAELVRCPDVPVPTQGRKRPLSIVINPPLTVDIMREEIFGPALVLLTYSDINHVVAEINSGERPLALYYFGEDEAERTFVLEHTRSGGVTLDDALMHAAMEDAPFGGVGASGMGHYHGREGFAEFSHARTVFRSAPVDPRGEWGLLPPFSDQFAAMMAAQVTR
ncbi:coniferyl aldehyde dehydrogenase [Marinobacter sp. X15-166B]|uniref:coniferyl aldehyde dehydrogenase n=1 Tax=Marinobacter sp. X15-166B TaxID=1897620 RepID=UPI00085C940A|nr:coniferyl aldehyde dehydrogenase [Marinobacter sp. X15-166B]OEY66296.1 aldehyde dehydrogenase [Marinobacter sp. X15-166B]